MGTFLGVVSGRCLIASPRPWFSLYLALVHARLDRRSALQCDLWGSWTEMSSAPPGRSIRSLHYVCAPILVLSSSPCLSRPVAPTFLVSILSLPYGTFGLVSPRSVFMILTQFDFLSYIDSSYSLFIDTCFYPHEIPLTS